MFALHKFIIVLHLFIYYLTWQKAIINKELVSRHLTGSVLIYHVFSLNRLKSPSESMVWSINDKGVDSWKCDERNMVDGGLGTK